MPNTFVERCLAGTASLFDYRKFVKSVENGPGTSYWTPEVWSSFLGVTKEEMYTLYRSYYNISVLLLERGYSIQRWVRELEALGGQAGKALDRLY